MSDAVPGAVYRKAEEMKTPTTPGGLATYDHIHPELAVRLAWTNPGMNPEWHEKAKQAVRDAMPLLARALDRMDNAV